MAGTPSSPSSSSADTQRRFKGVRMRAWGKWVSEIRLPNSRARLWLGSYATAEQAARAFDVAVLCLRGSSTTLNFPESPPPYAPLGLPHHQIQQLAASAAADAAAATSAAPDASRGMEQTSLAASISRESGTGRAAIETKSGGEVMKEAVPEPDLSVEELLMNNQGQFAFPLQELDDYYDSEQYMGSVMERNWLLSDQFPPTTTADVEYDCCVTEPCLWCF